ncbi:hypothetical protein [Nitrobacter sp. NHB1]
MILLLLAVILAFIATAWRQDRVATWLFLPMLPGSPSPRRSTLPSSR